MQVYLIWWPDDETRQSSIYTTYVTPEAICFHCISILFRPFLNTFCKFLLWDPRWRDISAIYVTQAPTGDIYDICGDISGLYIAPSFNIYTYMHLSSTLPEIDPDTAYVVCISVSLGFRQKPSDTALLSVIALTTFNCIVSASVTKGVLVCFVVTVHWWRHRTHYDVTEAYRVLRNILTVDLNNGATRADLRGIPKHYEATAKAGR